MSNYTKVRVECRTRQQSTPVCVQVPRNVPEPLECTPSGGSGGGNLPLCPEGRRLFEPGRLSAIVDDLTHGGWGQHIQAGAVVVRCC